MDIPNYPDRCSWRPSPRCAHLVFFSLVTIKVGLLPQNIRLCNIFLTISGVMSGVVISHYWLSQMGNPSTIMVSTITALYDVGAVFGAIGAAIVGDKLGRKRTLMLGCTVLIIGSILMATCFERIQMMFGRILTGLGIGFITSGKSCCSSSLLRKTN